MNLVSLCNQSKNCDQKKMFVCSLNLVVCVYAFRLYQCLPMNVISCARGKSGPFSQLIWSLTYSSWHFDMSVFCTVSNRLEPRSGHTSGGPDLGSSLFASKTTLLWKNIVKVILWFRHSFHGCKNGRIRVLVPDVNVSPNSVRILIHSEHLDQFSYAHHISEVLQTPPFCLRRS